MAKYDRSRAWAEARELLREHRGSLSVGLALMVVNRMSGLVLPYTSKFLIDDVITKHRAELLLPLAGIAGMLYFTVSYPTPDGDVIKAAYMLTTIPAWALAFGYATERAIQTRARVPVVAVLIAAAVVTLRFGLYGSPLGGLL